LEVDPRGSPDDCCELDSRNTSALLLLEAVKQNSKAGKQGMEEGGNRKECDKEEGKKLEVINAH